MFNIPLPTGNLLLEALEPKDLALIAPHLEPHTCERGEVLFEPGQQVECIAFPCGPMVATLNVAMRDGRSAETATIGREGAIGGVVSQGYLSAFSRAVVQIGGPLLSIEAYRLQEAKRASPTVRNLFTRYADCLLAQVLQSAACNALHAIEERCARFLLVLEDRTNSNVLAVTHEMLAEQLGIQRSYLTKVLRLLQEQDLIEIERGRVVIRDRKRLEGVSCECHSAVRRHYKDVLGAIYHPAGPLLAVRPAEEPVPQT